MGVAISLPKVRDFVLIAYLRLRIFMVVSPAGQFLRC